MFADRGQTRGLAEADGGAIIMSEAAFVPLYLGVKQSLGGLGPFGGGTNHESPFGTETVLET